MSFEIRKIGCVGFGPMGRLGHERMLPVLPDGAIFDPRMPELNSLDEVADTDVIQISVPAGNFEEAVLGLRSRMEGQGKAPLLFENMSVKEFPEWIVKAHFRDYPDLLHCHPLFGPQTINNDDEKVIIVTRHKGEKAEYLLDFWDKMGFVLKFMTSEEHDKLMAKIHAATFALGRGATRAGISQAVQTISTPSALIAASLGRLDEKHTQDLFKTIVGYNRFALKELEAVLSGVREAIHINDENRFSMTRAMHMAGVLELGNETV